MARTRFWVCVHCDHDLGDITLGQSHDTPLGHGQQLCEILSRSNLAMRSYGPDTDFGYVCTVTLTSEIWPWVKVRTHPSVIDNNRVKYYPDRTWQWEVMARTLILGCCALWPWPWRYDLGSRSWHTLGLWTTIVWNIIQIQLSSEVLWPGHGFPVYMHCDLDLGDMTLGQGHDTPLGHGQQLSEILSRSNLAVRSYGPDTDFQYVCTVTLTLEIWPWVKVMTHPWVMDNNWVKYYPDPTWQWGVMARTRISSMCALWPWPWRCDFGSRSWHTLVSWTTIVWNYIQIGQGITKLWPGHGFPVCVHCDLDLGDMTLGQGHDTPLGHGQLLCEIISISDKGVRSYGPDTMWTDGQTDRQTDIQTGWFLYTPPPKLCLRGV